MRCPLALINQPFTQAAMDLWASFDKGITPQGKGISAETAIYRKTMRALSMLRDEAEGWYSREAAKKRGG